MDSEWQEPTPDELKPGVTGYPLDVGPPTSGKKSSATGGGQQLSQRHVSPQSQGPSSPLSLDIASERVSKRQEEKFKARLKTSVGENISQTSDLRDEDADSSSNRRRSGRARGNPINYYEKARIDMGLKDSVSAKPTNGTASTAAEKSPSGQMKIRFPVKREVPGNNVETPERPKTPEPQTKREATTPEPPSEFKIKRIKIASPQKPRDNAFGFGPKPDPFQPASSSRQETPSDSIPNNDYCSSCGCAGRLLCCETCPRSFHFTCIDPPMLEEEVPEGAWYCRECFVRRNPPLPYRKGLFSQMLNQLERRNPKQFKLPKNICERFEGVTMNEIGEYEDEIKPIKGKSLPFSVEDRLPLQDKNGNPILCYRCNKSALHGLMVNCDTCTQSWHVDCLAQPLWTVGSRWKCPNHADQAVKLPRRPKRTQLVDTHLRRGFRNDGNIEVFDESDEEEVQDIPFFDVKDTPFGVSAKVNNHYSRQNRLMSSDGVIYRLPERSIKLDFIDAVHIENSQPYPETRAVDVLVALDELATRPTETVSGVRDLCYFQKQGSRDLEVATFKANLYKLLDAALYEEDQHDRTQHPPMSHLTSPPPDDNISPPEREQLLAIKQLMQIKGKDALLRFLTDQT